MSRHRGNKLPRSCEEPEERNLPPRLWSWAQSGTNPSALWGPRVTLLSILHALGAGGALWWVVFFGVTFGDSEGGRNSFFGEKLRCFKLQPWLKVGRCLVGCSPRPVVLCWQQNGAQRSSQRSPGSSPCRPSAVGPWGAPHSPPLCSIDPTGSHPTFPTRGAAAHRRDTASRPSRPRRR